MSAELFGAAIEIVAADIGGTNARFALATVKDGKVLDLDAVVSLEAAQYPSFQTALEAYGLSLGRAFPRHVAMAIAGPYEGEVLRMTNNPWVIRPRETREALGLETFVIINDFAAVGHAVAVADAASFDLFAGPVGGLPQEGVISIVGAGTGLGVSQILRHGGGARIVATEGGHTDFAPTDAIEDEVLRLLRPSFGRVSVERILSGPGLFSLYGALARISDERPAFADERSLWTAAIAGSNPLARQALDRFCAILGGVCGDIVLVQGSSALVLAGGIVPRLGNLLAGSNFVARFRQKGRFTERMAGIPIFRILHPQPGLLGAAAAFADRYSIGIRRM